MLELDAFRAMVSDSVGDQQATADAVAALRTVLEARLARKKTTILDATNVERAVRAGLVQAARRHGVPVGAVLMGTPASLCVIRQTARTPDQAVPADTHDGHALGRSVVLEKCLVRDDRVTNAHSRPMRRAVSIA